MLDDAIREHLELKRLSGADPGEVAREERDVLGPVQREAHTPQDQEASDAVDGEPAVSAGASALDAPESADAESADELLTHGPGQETVEIDMDGELTAESQATPAPQAGDRAAPVAHPAHTSPGSGESLEWEMPGEPAGDGGEQPAEEEHVAGDQPVEDVLEETPDFLRETPEQDRLWFEQRPPRDFDFNE
jgi:hypothetical protein